MTIPPAHDSVNAHTDVDGTLRERHHAHAINLYQIPSSTGEDLTMPDSDSRRSAPWLAPGQTASKKGLIPTGEKSPTTDALDLDHWRLIVDGLVERRIVLTYDDVLALPQKDRVADIHCVTRWSAREVRFTGFPLALLLDRAGVSPEARFVRFEAYSPRNHDTSLPLALAREDTWLVHRVNGEVLTPVHGYPLRTITPSRYFYKSLKWVHRIELVANDRLGYWERESFYHNNADPWRGDERYITGSAKPEEIERLRSSGNIDSLRGSKVILSAELPDWNPVCRDLSRMQMKNCDLRRAQLQRVNLRGVNLTNSNLQGANLTDADCEGADLEGADFSGANLTNANLLGTALSATTFFTVLPDGTTLGARVDGMRWQRSLNLLEDQEAFLEANVPPEA